MFDSVFIMGPTACGKTSIAVKTALLNNGEIISADSRQVFRSMDIGTGKDLDEYNLYNINYHMIDVVSPNDKFSLYDYMSGFEKSFAKILSQKKLPLICGGTGLYIEALLKGFSLSDIPEDIDYRNKMNILPKENLMQKLSYYPEIYSKTDLSSKKRIIRSLEIAEKGGKFGKNENIFVKNPLNFLVYYPRDEIKARIENRLKTRIDNGMIEEGKKLLQNGLDLIKMKSFGMEYKRMAEYISGEIDYPTFFNNLLTDIFRLAKRQMTWFRGMKKRGISYIEIDLSKTSHDETVRFITSNILK
ncbi:MAG TPA: tRNA (adenosine(37)-N6)-dimethylallyltransferase MiaA [Spirochaetota bacterium]|nr:tRNA (adenosine(37)-N6)-dimethylallyltransferase MiaA [Spirochaetota bacterium]HQE58155.1 tRNA (adenosine(37)-N6)-dimethylallyltransferase MiaA [Spirochaetota bacterium]